jgi:hypothetical protein
MKTAFFSPSWRKALFKGHETFGAHHYFKGLEQHSVAIVDSCSAVEALSDVDTNEDVDQIVGGVGGFIHFLSLFDSGRIFQTRAHRSLRTDG